MAMAHDDPELRARVRAELLYPAKPQVDPELTNHQRMALRDLHRVWGRTVPYLSRQFGIPESVVRDAIGEGR